MISRNEFLRLIIEAHAHALDEIGNMNFWVDQYYLWTFDGVRDERIHDTTAKVMIPYEAQDKARGIESREFYELMQSYRHMPSANQTATIAAFEAVKKFIHEHYELRHERLTF